MREMTSRMTRRAPTAPASPAPLSPAAWRAAGKRILGECKADNGADWAAALTYYSVLSIFPAMLVIVSLVGLGGKSVSQDLISHVGTLAPGSVKQVLVNAVTELQ